MLEKNRILVATSGFKNFWTPEEASSIISTGLKREGVEIEELFVGDGGRGTIDALEKNFSETASRVNLETVDEQMNLIETWYLVFEKDNKKVVYIELASAAGAHLNKEKTPLEASSYGAGLIIKHALENCHPDKIILGLGDSATTDGGMGIMQALGVDFLDKENKIITQPGCAGILGEVEKIEFTEGSANLLKKGAVEFELYCDGNSIVTGDDGCWMRILNKGGDDADLKIAQENISHFFSIIETIGKENASVTPSSGCAGGIAGGLYGLLNAKLVLGSAKLLELVNFREKARNSDLIITGEGEVDPSTFTGKMTHVIAEIAKEIGVETLLLTTNIIDSTELAIKYFDYIYLFLKNTEDEKKSSAKLRDVLDKVKMALIGKN